MYIGKLDFKKALFISALWHFLLSVLVVITINPVGFSKSKFSTVSFLGPILQETQMQKDNIAVVQKPSITQADITKWGKLLDASDIKVSYPEKIALRESLNVPKEAGYKIPFKDILADYKEPPHQEYLLESHPTYELSMVSVEGKLKGREIIYRPTYSSNYIWEEALGSLGKSPDELLLEINVSVSQEGKIETLEVARSTQNREIDSQATRYVKEWIFVPVAVAFKEKSQQGTIIIRFNRIK